MWACVTVQNPAEAKSYTMVCWVRNTLKDQLPCSVSETELQKIFPFGVDSEWKISVENYISILFISIFLKWKWTSPEISAVPFKVLFWWMFESTKAYRKMLKTVLHPVKILLPFLLLPYMHPGGWFLLQSRERHHIANKLLADIRCFLLMARLKNGAHVGQG